MSYFADWILGKTQGLSYRQSEFVGVSLLGAYSHTFSIRNNTDQVVRTSGATVQGSGASIKSNDCSVIEVDGNCEITIDYNVGKLDFGKVSVSMLTDLVETPSFDLAVTYFGTQSASISVSDMISIANSGVYSSTNSWVKNGSSIQTPALGDNEFSQLAITGLAAGRLSFDLNVSTEKNNDFFNVYINGYLSERVSGVESGEFSMGLPRENNTVVFEYKKDLAVSYGDDRVTISNLNYSKDTESLIPDGELYREELWW